ncbi:protein phosphatase inhibitor 2-like [Penaeus monodon]|uniref:protein phosphatase inhibitor 2-like n=1 Tax=Penaeus monodon TaxID=6687 RepID=UPI0018A73E6A|nr:protein phosphatase inhibitor 2-like [Penaeus monodon]
MAANLSKQPRKGILKNSSSFEGNERQREKETKWDEMNILATLHPKDKDYGHMKIEEPKTPFAHYEEGDSGDEHDGLDADLLAKKIQLGGSELPKALIEPEPEEESEEEISPEEREKRKLFEMKRKKHYNEFYAVKLARKLMQNDDDDDEEEDKKDSPEAEASIGKDDTMEEIVEEGNGNNECDDMALAEEQASGD